MNKRDEIYNEIESIAEKNNIEFNTHFIHRGRGVDCGELCIEYNEKEGFILFAHDRELETYHFSTKNTDEFKYKVFRELCNHNGYEYELKYRKGRNTGLNSDNGKIAFEYALYQLNKINTEWMEKTIPEYEKLLNKGHMNKNVYFNKKSMKFEMVQQICRLEY